MVLKELILTMFLLWGEEVVVLKELYFNNFYFGERKWWS